MDSFFLMGAKPLLQDSPSMKLHELLDWHFIAHHLKGLYQREKSGVGGPDPYNRLGMFKLMLLGQWHSLSDTQLEQALRVRLDFMVFTGFEPSADELPDFSTIWRLRNRLAQAKLTHKLLTHHQWAAGTSGPEGTRHTRRHHRRHHHPQCGPAQ